MFLSSFSLPEQVPIKTDTTRQDEIKVNMTFEPAKILVSDQRDITYLLQSYELAAQSNENIAAAIDNFNSYLPYLIQNQERRLESCIGQLSRQTGWDEDRINTAFNNKRKYDFWRRTSFLATFALVLSYITFTKGEIIDWHLLLFKSAGAILIGTTIYYIVSQWLTALPFMSDYTFLVNLSKFMQ